MDNNRLRIILIQFLVYISLFIGTGFLSGSIVHFPINPTRFSIIGVIGAFIFVASSTINEAVFNKKNFKDEGIVKIIFFSLVLSLGIGMISGGVQHFDEYPLYAQNLIPIGIVVSLIAYLLKSNIKLTQTQLIKLTGFTVIIIIFLTGTLRVYAQSIINKGSDGHEHGDVEATKIIEKDPEVQHEESVIDDQSFIRMMIPHHEDAIDSSQSILEITKNSKIITLAENVITTQANEVVKMKEWHQEWFNTPYEKGESYQSMMSPLKKNDIHIAEETYLQDMIAHHKSAVEMSRVIQSKTNREQLKEMANAIMISQAQEITLMQQILIDIEGISSEDNH